MAVICNVLNALAPFSPMLTSIASAGIASLIAILLGARVYRAQKNEDRKLQIQSEKRALYRDFLSTFEQALIVPIGENDTWNLDPSIRKLAGLYSEIRVISCDDVSDACGRTLIAINSKHMDRKESQFVLSAGDGKERTHFENAIYERDKAIKAMQLELAQL
jgi:hypothetical protein